MKFYINIIVNINIMSILINYSIPEIELLILSYTSNVCNFNKKINKCEIKNRIVSLINIIVLSKNKKYIDELVLLKKSLYLLNKYNNEYDDITIDIINTGLNLPFTQSTIDNFNENTEYDFKMACFIFKNSINLNYGRLRCRYNVSPLMLACLNKNISNETIIWMLENGANKNYKHILNDDKISIIDDLNPSMMGLEAISQKRFNSIKNIFYNHDMQNLKKLNNNNILMGKFFYKLKYCFVL